MSKINDLNEEQQKIIDELFWLDDNDEQDEEQIERLNTKLFKIRVDAVRTLEFFSALLLEARAVLEGREEVKRRAERRRKTAETAVDKLTEICERIMVKFEIPKIALENCNLSLQMSPGKIEYAPGFDPATLPQDCVKVEYKPLAKELKAYIEDGAQFEGVFLTKRETLRVK